MGRMPAQMIGARTCAANIVSFIRTILWFVCRACTFLTQAAAVAGAEAAVACRLYKGTQ